LGLSGFHVKQADVVALLARLPPRSLYPPRLLWSVELSFLRSMDGGGDSYSLLRGMRRSLSWRETKPADRPVVVVGHDRILSPATGLAVWVDHEAVGGFLYGDGPNPFWEESDAPGKSLDRSHVVTELKGCSERDIFHQEHERPYVDDSTLTALGINLNTYEHPDQVDFKWSTYIS
jgi:hypothetical protein